MAYAFASASSQYITGTLAATINYPQTQCGWFSTTTNAANQVLVATHNASTYARILTYIPTTRNVACSDTNEAATTSTSFSAGASSHGCGVRSAATDIAAYLNGGGKGTNAVGVAQAAGNLIALGARTNGTWGSYMNGTLAEVAVWSVALSDEEIASLAKGFSPRRIRPQSLVFYAPLIRNLSDLRDGITLTNNNSATVSDHPRVY